VFRRLDLRGGVCSAPLGDEGDVMDWNSVGDWLKANAGTGAALVGSLLTGNVPAAMALGVKLVAGATGTADPLQALQALQQDPATVVKLRELAIQEQANINSHIEKMAQLQFEDEQAEQHETQETIRAGDKADDRLVRWTRPLQSWVSLLGAGAYVFANAKPDTTILMILLALPWAYAGLRTIQHANEMKAVVQQATAK
jgi:hypothetical protein